MEDFKVINNYLMIRLPEEIDHHESVDISSKADRYIMSGRVENVVFDFERTTFTRRSPASAARSTPSTRTAGYGGYC